MDLNLWDCLGKGKTHIIVIFHRTDLFICSHSRERKTLSYRLINRVVTGETKSYLPSPH